MPQPNKISLVIPVFNTADYLPELLDSLLAQRRRPDEIIFVNDGSTDESPALLERFAEQCGGVVVINQKNQGQAIARNNGLHRCTGDYLCFIDADDILAPDYFSTLLAMAEEDDLDIAMINGWNYHEGRKADTLIFAGIPDTGVQSGEKWFQDRWLDHYMPHYCWMNLYRRSFIEQHGFGFPNIPPHEDVIWVTETLLAARRFRFSASPLIRYRKKLAWPEQRTTAKKKGVFIRHKKIESTFHNIRELARISRRPELEALTRDLIRRSYVPSCCNLVRSIRHLNDLGQRTHYLRKLAVARIPQLAIQGARGIAEHWRVLRYMSLAKL